METPSFRHLNSYHLLYCILIIYYPVLDCSIRTLWKSILSSKFNWTKHKFVECTSILCFCFSFLMSTYLIYNTYVFNHELSTHNCLKYKKRLWHRRGITGPSHTFTPCLHGSTFAVLILFHILLVQLLWDFNMLKSWDFYKYVCWRPSLPIALVISGRVASLCDTAVTGIAPCPVLMKMNWVHLNLGK